MLLINMASKIGLKFGSVDSEIGMKTPISGSFCQVTEVKGVYQQDEDGRGPQSYPGRIRA